MIATTKFYLHNTRNLQLVELPCDRSIISGFFANNGVYIIYETVQSEPSKQYGFYLLNTGDEVPETATCVASVLGNQINFSIYQTEEE